MGEAADRLGYTSLLRHCGHDGGIWLLCRSGPLEDVTFKIPTKRRARKDSQTRLGLTMWSSAGATIGVVAELMDMHAPLSRWVAALDIIGDGGWRRFGGLLEGDGTANGRVTAKNCHCWRRRRSQLRTDSWAENSGKARSSGGMRRTVGRSRALTSEHTRPSSRAYTGAKSHQLPKPTRVNM